jgi:UDP-3-O-[3-hydroxymyristoyl] N-acetylglucosamine deacetylase
MDETTLQRTVKTAVTFHGTGLHGGQPVRMVVKPASAGHGIVFLRTDLAQDDPLIDARVPARWDTVIPSKLCTLVANAAGVSVSTVEHVMAALAGCAIHNALIEIDGPEVPILDGSAVPFVEGFITAGTVGQDAAVRAIRILQTVEVRDGDAVARLEPAETMEIAFEIDFDVPAIGQQGKRMSLANGAFVRELSDSRTFCRQSDVDAMRANGLALGGTYENAVVFDGDVVLSPGGLRHRDEPVRHKMLDAVGDLFLAGAPILGRYTGIRAGHSLTNRLLRALVARPDAWTLVDVGAQTGCKLPGIGVHEADLPLRA